MACGVGPPGAHREAGRGQLRFDACPAELRGNLGAHLLAVGECHKNTNFDFDLYDTFEWYLRLGPLSNANAEYLHGKIPFWNDVMEHPDYDAFWKKEAWVNQLHSSTVPNLNVAGFSPWPCR